MKNNAACSVHLILNAGLRSQLLSVLMSYTPLWLRIGLETVFGEVIETRSLIDTNTLKVNLCMTLILMTRYTGTISFGQV